jgi:4-amino-4-deoxy-L-arabinose transferase-like glycosyltransferase
MTPGRLLALFLVAVTSFRWWWNLARPLSAEEAYLALCGFIPSAAYFDGPGGTPWLVALGISIAGAGGFGATFFWPLLAAVASIATYALASSLVGKREGLAIAVLLNLLPVFNDASLSASCAMPLTAAALTSLSCAWRALDKDSSAWWLAAGLSAALGLLFSYTAWFILPVIALVLLASHRWRPRLLTAGFWAMWIPPIAVYIVLLQWNAQHGWIHFIGGTWKTSINLHLSNLAPSIVAASNAITPLVLLALLIAAAAAFTRIAVSPKIKFVSLPAIAALLAALYAALRGLPAQSPGLLAASLALPLIAWLPAQMARVPGNRIVTIVFVTAALWCAVTLRRPDNTAFIDANVGRAIDDIRAEQTDPTAPPLLLIAENAPIAAALALALPDVTPAASGHPPVYTVESAAARSQFDLWPRYDQFVEAEVSVTPEGLDPFTEQDGTNPFIGRSALYITTQQADDLPQAITAAFTAVELISEVTADDGRILRVYLCSDYQTMPL